MKRKLETLRCDRVISGGQVGADIAALRAAARAGIATGGHAPAGYRTQAGENRALATYGLREVRGRGPGGYIMRSMLNVDEADATLAIRLRPSAGTDKTISYALLHGWPRGAAAWPVPGGDAAFARPTSAYRPVFVVLRLCPDAAAEARAWLDSVRPAVLNVCGNRDGGIEDYEKRIEAFLLQCFGPGDELE